MTHWIFPESPASSRLIEKDGSLFVKDIVEGGSDAKGEGGEQEIDPPRPLKAGLSGTIRARDSAGTSIAKVRNVSRLGSVLAGLESRT